jgi:hypothetical protein
MPVVDVVLLLVFGWFGVFDMLVFFFYFDLFSFLNILACVMCCGHPKDIWDAKWLTPFTGYKFFTIWCEAYMHTNWLGCTGCAHHQFHPFWCVIGLTPNLLGYAVVCTIFTGVCQHSNQLNWCAGSMYPISVYMEQNFGVPRG